MKLNINILLLLLASCLPAAAQTGLSDNQRPVGYTVTDRIDVEGAYFGQAATYQIGALMDADMLKPYTGCKVVGVRVAAACDLGRSPVFLTAERNGELVNLHSQNQKLFQGWNNVFFNGDGFDITGEEGLFFGFAYTETADMVTNETGGICTVGDDQNDSFKLLMSNSLYEVTGVGKLCVQLIVDVTNLPSHSIALPMFDYGFRFKNIKEDMEIFTMVQNTGRAAVNNLRMGVQFDNLDPNYYDVNMKLGSGESDSWQQIISMSGLAVGRHKMTVWAEQADGENIAADRRGTKTVWFGLYDETMPRNMVYLEQYASPQYPASAMFNDVYDQLYDERFGDICRVTMHIPGSPLYVEGSDYFQNLYAYTYPCFTVNRAYFPGEAHTAYDFNDYFGVLPTDFLALIMHDIIDQDVSSPTFASVDVEGEYDAASGKLRVTATGSALEDAEAICGPLAVTLMVTEDDVVSPQTVVTSTGGTRKDSSYKHRDTLRGFITDAKGDGITLDDDKNFELIREFTVPADWNKSNLKVTALIHSANTAPGQGFEDVLNCARADVRDASGVPEISDDSEMTPEYFSLDGLRLKEAPRSGIYVERRGERAKLMTR
ncbi:MAG: Omp28-related outer membrane protein [Muribaculaceae bacterium]|nr:Omp28-related outer membrane protein [Muribaculaceae bacterium]